MPNTRCRALGAPYSVPNTRCRALGAPYSVPNTRCRALGAPYSVPSTRSPVLGAKYSVPSARCRGVLGPPYSVTLNFSGSPRIFRGAPRIFRGPPEFWVVAVALRRLWADCGPRPSSYDFDKIVPMIYTTVKGPSYTRHEQHRRKHLLPVPVQKTAKPIVDLLCIGNDALPFPMHRRPAFSICSDSCTPFRGEIERQLVHAACGARRVTRLLVGRGGTTSSSPQREVDTNSSPHHQSNGKRANFHYVEGSPRST